MRPRALSIVEVAVTLVVISIAAAVVVTAMPSGDRYASATTAQGALGEVLDAWVGARESDPGAALDASDLDPLVDGVTLTTGPAAEGAVSVAFGTDALGAATRSSDGDCWYVRRDAAAGPSDPLVVYGRAPAGATAACTGDVALGLDVDPGPPVLGERWSRPVLLA